MIRPRVDTGKGQEPDTIDRTPNKVVTKDDKSDTDITGKKGVVPDLPRMPQ